MTVGFALPVVMSCNKRTRQAQLERRPTKHALRDNGRRAIKPLPAPTDRTLGPIEGRFRPGKTTYHVGEPILVDLRVKNVSGDPLEFDVGADSKGALLHLRYTWVVTDDRGRTLCDLSQDAPAIWGGKLARIKLAPGEAWRDRQLINPACDALSQPGRYRITAVRVLSRFKSLPPSCSWLSPPDVTRPDLEPSVRWPERCLRAMSAHPVVASEFNLTIRPYERRSLAASVRDLEQRQDAEARHIVRFYREWLERTAPAVVRAALASPPTP